METEGPRKRSERVDVVNVPKTKRTRRRTTLRRSLPVVVWARRANNARAVSWMVWRIAGYVVIDILLCTGRFNHHN
jgi:uncharacterized membrane protein YkvA (DUF1232 family)